MGQLIHTCLECGYQSESDRYMELCPVCSSLEMHNQINPNGPVTVPAEAEPLTVFVPSDGNFFDENRCGFVR
jgi:hypothetical protein